MQVVVPPCQGCGIHLVSCQTWKLWTSLVQASFKAYLYIYGWAHKVETSKHIVLKSASTSEGFWGTTKSSGILCKTLFLLVKVVGFIWLVAKLGHNGPQSLWPASKPTCIYGWAHEVENSKHIVLRSVRTSL
jgi:hypothetical protein